MPKIPIYEAQAGITRSTAATVESALTYMPFVRATEQTGAMLEQRGVQLLEEHDKARSFDALNQLRGMSRGKLTELLNREGGNALGVQKEFNEWEDKARGKVEKENLTTFSQRDLFNKLATQRKQADLDNLAAHEVSEDRKYKNSVLKGLGGITESDVRSAAFDDDKVGKKVSVTGPDGKEVFFYNGMIGDYHIALDSVKSGMDNTADKLASVQVFRTAQIESLIDQNPPVAAKKLEEYRDELGDKYHILKKRLESQLASNKLEIAYEAVVNKFGSNYDAMWAFVNNPKNKTELGGLDYAETEKLASRVNGLRAQREAQESNAVTHMHRTQENTLSEITAQLAVTKDDVKKQQIMASLPELVKLQKLSVPGYNAIIRESVDGVREDDLNAIAELDDRLARHEDVSGLAIKMREQQKIKTTTADNYVKAGKKAPIAEGDKFINDYLNPGDMGTPDSRQLHAEARAYYYQRLREPDAPKDPIAFSREVVNSYRGRIKRTLEGSRQPVYMPKGAKNTDPIALSQALEATVEAYNSGMMGNKDDPYVANKYNEEYNYTYELYTRATKEVMFDEGLKRDAATSGSVDKSRKKMND